MGIFSGLFSGGALGGLFGAANSAVGGPLGAALGAVAGGFSSWSRKKAYSDAWHRSSDLTWDFWHAQNAYNDPAAQMQRFKAAGLNPNLIYGHMGNSPGPSFVRSEPEETTDFLEQLRYLQGFDLQERQLALQTANSAANLELAKANSLRNDRELSMEESLLPYKKALLEARISAFERGEGDVDGNLFGNLFDIFASPKTRAEFKAASNFIKNLWNQKPGKFGRVGSVARGIWNLFSR